MRGKRYLQGLILVLLCAVFGVQLGFGAGFGIYEGSARGNALGGTLVGRADDASAVYYNPAGITQLQGLQAMAGATFIFPETHVVTAGKKYETEANVWYPPHAYLTYQLTDKVWFGFGTFSQFGLGTEFDQSWPGRFNNYKAVIQSLTMNPNIAFKLNDKVSMAVGLDIVWLDIDLRQFVGSPLLTYTNQTLKGDSFGYGANVAIRYKPCDWLALGASYRSQVKQHITGDATFSGTLPSLSPYINNTSAGGNITLPDEVFLGATFYPTNRLSVELGGVWTNWSTFKSLTIDYDNPPIFAPDGHATSVKDWSSVWRIQLGAEYKALDWLDLRAGYVYDPTPIPDGHVDYLVPANDRHLFSVGPGFHFGNWSFDLSYTYIYILDRHVDARTSSYIYYPAEIEDGSAHLVGMTIGYKF